MTPYERAQAVAAAFTEHPGRNRHGVLTVTTRLGTLRLHRVEHDSHGGVQAWTVGVDGPPTHHIVNPPLLVSHPLGDIIRGKRRYLRDPARALAEVILTYQGES